jgi:hypothetical protein
VTLPAESLQFWYSQAEQRKVESMVRRGDRVVEEVSGYLSLLPNFKGQCRPLLMSRFRFSSSSSYLQSLAQIILYTYTNMMEETK